MREPACHMQALNVMFDACYLVSPTAWGSGVRVLEQAVLALPTSTASGPGSSSSSALPEEQHSLLGTVLYWSVLPCVQDMVRLRAALAQLLRPQSSFLLP